MRTIGILIICAGLLSSASCKLCKKDGKGEKEPQEKHTAIIVEQGYILPDNNASTEIAKISIEGNILSIDVSYSGGCAEHEFKLYFNGAYKKSIPPKVDFHLYHDSKGDACRELKTQTLKFDISGAQYKGQSKIMVKVGDSNEVEYSY